MNSKHMKESEKMAINHPNKEDAQHDIENKITVPLSSRLEENKNQLQALFKDCSDVIQRDIEIDPQTGTHILGIYIDGMANRTIVEEFLLTRIMDFKNMGSGKVGETLAPIDKILEHFSATLDIKEVTSMDDIVLAALAGDVGILIDGVKRALVIAARGFPARSVGEADSEAVVRGPKDAFTETLRFNTVLIRRRIRDTKLKFKAMSYGVRSRTDIIISYIEDIAKPNLVQEVEERLAQYDIDGILDSGYIEQIIEDSWKSPFPQTQATERPDKVAASLLEGKVAIIVDNSPFVIIVPATLNAFFQASEDYYQRWEIMSFTRILRYIVSFLAFSMPALYIATVNFHPAMLPTDLAVAIAAARGGVAFGSVLEIIIMELAFELLREAGIRVPGPIGSVIGLVGGIIIGQAAVDAKLVSPMIVIIVAITAIATSAIPSYALTTSFRLVRYFFIALAAMFGLYGFLIALLILFAHLCSLESFKIPYLSPYTAYMGGEGNHEEDRKDTLIRFPLIMQTMRPIFAQKKQRIRFRLRNPKESTMANGNKTTEEDKNKTDKGDTLC